MVGWNVAAVEKIDALAAGVVDRTDSERQEQAAVELEQPGEHKVVQILQRPAADTECTVVSQGVVVVVAVAERAPAEHVAAAAVAAAVVDAAAAVATGSFVSHHTHSLHTEQTAQVEGGVVRALVPAQMAIVDYTPAAAEAELLLLP